MDEFENEDERGSGSERCSEGVCELTEVRDE